MPNTTPPKPRPIQEGTAKDELGRLTVPDSWALYNGAIGYHVPKHLNNAAKLSQALAWVR